MFMTLRATAGGNPATMSRATTGAFQHIEQLDI